MYLVEIEPGREELYDSVTALAAAIQRGAVGPQSRIFHRSSSSWVSITVHPEYKKVVAAKASEPLPPLTRSRWTFFGLESNGREIHEPEATAGKAKGEGPKQARRRSTGLKGLLARAFRGRPAVPSISKTTGS